jgi:hypothetical protein
MIWMAIFLVSIHSCWLFIIAISPPDSENTYQSYSKPIAHQGNSKKPIILLVPGFSAKDVISFGSSNGLRKYQCLPEATPISQDESDYFTDLPGWLIADGGFDVRIALYESNRERTPSIETNAECLRNQIIRAAGQSPTHDLIIIAHSMGGLVTRAYVQSERFTEDREQYNIPIVNTVFLVGTPNNGTPLHFWLNLILRCESADTNQRAACEFSNSEWMEEFNNRYDEVPEGIDFYAIGGALHNGLLGAILGSYICLLSGPNDGNVPAKSAVSFHGARAAAICNEAHIGGVGEPSFFSEYKGQKSDLYNNCIYPVLIDGNRDRCLGENHYNCESLVYFSIISAEIIITLTLAYINLQK